MHSSLKPLSISNLSFSVTATGEQRLQRAFLECAWRIAWRMRCLESAWARGGSPGRHGCPWERCEPWVRCGRKDARNTRRHGARRTPGAMGIHGLSRMSGARRSHGKLRATGILAPWRVSRKQKAECPARLLGSLPHQTLDVSGRGRRLNSTVSGEAPGSSVGVS